MSRETPFGHIAVCVDRSRASAAALDEARRLRRLGPGRLTLVHVVEDAAISPAAWSLPDPEQLRRALRRWLGGMARPDEGEEVVLLEGEHPAEAIVEWAEGAGVDLIVASAHRGRVQRALLGSFAAHLAYHAPCPVLLVRPGPDLEPAAEMTR